jgi:hypothetical protein
LGLRRASSPAALQSILDPLVDVLWRGAVRDTCQPGHERTATLTVAAMIAVAALAGCGASETGGASAPTDSLIDDSDVDPCAHGDNDRCRRQCDAGDARSCTSLGLVYKHGRGQILPNEVEALRLFELACTAGDPAGCNGVGWHYLFGKGIAKDEAAAVRAYRRACDGGHAAGCNNLGVLHKEGRGGLAPDDRAALPLFGSACDGGDAAGCSSLAGMLRHGRGTHANAQRAAQLYRKACDAGFPVACVHLATGIRVADRKRRRPLRSEDSCAN